MTLVVALLLVNGALGAFDTLWYHEHVVGLPRRADTYRTELRLHAARDIIYAIIYGTIGWWRWEGPWAALLILLLATEIVITMADFVVEDRTRRLSAGERVLHAIMAIVYGAMLVTLLPILIERMGISGSLGGGPTGVSPIMATAATLLGIGIALSGLRDALAARAVGPLSNGPGGLSGGPREGVQRRWGRAPTLGPQTDRFSTSMRRGLR